MVFCKPRKIPQPDPRLWNYFAPPQNVHSFHSFFHRGLWRNLWRMWINSVYKPFNTRKFRDYVNCRYGTNGNRNEKECKHRLPCPANGPRESPKEPPHWAAFSLRGSPVPFRLRILPAIYTIYFREKSERNALLSGKLMIQYPRWLRPADILYPRLSCGRKPIGYFTGPHT